MKKNSSMQSFPLPILRDAYLKSIAVKGFSENTLSVREVYLEMFLRWCAHNGIVSAGEVTFQIVERYQEYLFFHQKLDGQPLSSSSQYSRFALIRLWFRWIQRYGYIAQDSTTEIELPRLAYRLPTVLTKAQVEHVLAQPQYPDTRRHSGSSDIGNILLDGHPSY